ncbi:dTDP-4-dehydrorhamnose 3,5-epimerase [Sphingomonas bisphenolicum]
MKVIPTGIAGLAILEPRLFQDDRGFFMESWNSQTFRDAGLDLTFVQDNHSRSDRGVLRGLHFQRPNPQGKLVRVTSGSVWDVAVDLRRSSATFGRWFGVELSAANKRMFWIPPGFAHGFLCLEDGTDFLYKCTAFYQPAQEHSLLWNDPALNIPWPVAGMDIQLSSKDRDGLPLAHIQACD